LNDILQNFGLQELTFEPDASDMDRLRHNTVERINELSYHYQVGGGR
jgi:hypothetical protein